VRIGSCINSDQKSNKNRKNLTSSKKSKRACTAIPHENLHDKIDFLESDSLERELGI
jgi:hypothetical protein